MGKTLGVILGLSPVFVARVRLGSGTEQSFGESYQMIEIFAEKFTGLFDLGTRLANKFGAKRVSLLVKRAGSSTKRLATPSIASPKLPLPSASLTLPQQFASPYRWLPWSHPTTHLPFTQHAVKYPLSLAPGGCGSGGCAAVTVQLARPETNRQNTETA